MFGDTFKKIRAKKRINKKDMIRLANTTNNYITRLEKNECELSPVRAIEFINLLSPGIKDSCMLINEYLVDYPKERDIFLDVFYEDILALRILEFIHNEPDRWILHDKEYIKDFFHYIQFVASAASGKEVEMFDETFSAVIYKLSKYNKLKISYNIQDNGVKRPDLYQFRTSENTYEIKYIGEGNIEDFLVPPQERLNNQINTMASKLENKDPELSKTFVNVLNDVVYTIYMGYVKSYQTGVNERMSENDKQNK